MKKGWNGHGYEWAGREYGFLAGIFASGSATLFSPAIDLLQATRNEKPLEGVGQKRESM